MHQQKPQLASPLSDFTFENDFGKSPLLVGRFTTDQGTIAVISILTAFVGAAMAGLPLALLVIVAALNDFLFAGHANIVTRKRSAASEAQAWERLNQWVQDPSAEMSPAVPAATEQTNPPAAIATPTTTTASPAAALPPSTIDRIAAAALQVAVEQPRLRSPVDYLIGDRLRTALIVAVSGGGKDMILSHGCREVLQRYPAYTLVILDCKDDPKEYSYYPTHPKVIIHRLNIAVASDSEILEWANHALNGFINLPEKAILICNEGIGIRRKCSRYIDVVEGLTSSGDSREKYAWEAGQSAHTDDLLINGAARSRFRPLVIGMKGEEMQVEAVLAARFVADSARNMTAISHEISRSPVGRAWSDGRNWFAMPQLHNYAGYDRDSRSFITSPQKVAASGEEVAIEPLDNALTFDELIEEDLPTVPADDLELNLMLYFLNRKGQKKSARDITRSGAKWTKGLKQSDIEEFLLLLSAEGKLKREDDLFYY